MYIEQSVKFERKFESHATCMIFNLVSTRLHLFLFFFSLKRVNLDEISLLFLYRVNLVSICFSFSSNKGFEKFILYMYMI